MNTDPIADLLTRIRNASLADHEDVSVPHSNAKENILKVLKKYGFIDGFSVKAENVFRTLEIQLKEDRKGLKLKRISSPGQRIYVKSDEIKRIKNGLGIGIITTSKGIMSSVEAKRQKLGGELICEVY